MDIEDERVSYRDENGEEVYVYGYGFRGNGRDGRGGGPNYASSATSSVEESLDSMGRRMKKNPYADEHHFSGRDERSLEDARRRGPPHPPFAQAYSPAVLYQYGSATAAGDGNDRLGGGMKWAGMTRHPHVGRLSPILSGLSLPSVSVPSVGAAGAGASVRGGGAAGENDTWDQGSGMGEGTMFGNSNSTPDLRFTDVDEHDREQKKQRVGEDRSGRETASTRVIFSRGDESFKEWERREKEKEKERKLLSAQSPQAFLLPRPRVRVETLERGEMPGPVGGYRAGQSGAGGGGSREMKGGKQGLMNMPSASFVGGGGEENATKMGNGGPAKIGVILEQSRGRSYTRDDSSLLSLDR